MTALLSTHDLACARGTRTLFRALSFDVAAGQVLRVEGANGAGKTSLLRLLAGLALPSAGEVRWCAAPIAAQREQYARELLYLGHVSALKDDLTPLENLRVMAQLHGDPADEATLRAALERWGLAAVWRLPARLLSAGQRRRAALARLALTRARLWILDEPFNALDSAACEHLSRCIEQHVQQGGLTVITSHQALPPLGRAPLACLALGT
jgi:heme exporter protein A